MKFLRTQPTAVWAVAFAAVVSFMGLGLVDACVGMMQRADKLFGHVNRFLDVQADALQAELDDARALNRDMQAFFRAWHAAGAARNERTLLDQRDVMIHDMDRPSHIAGTQRGDDVAVLVHAAFG